MEVEVHYQCRQAEEILMATVVVVINEGSLLRYVVLSPGTGDEDSET